MKKIFFATFALLSGLALTSCDKDYTEGLEPPMSSPEETAQTVGSLNISPVATIDLATVTGDMVKVCNFTAPTMSDAAAQLSSVTLTMDEDVIEMNENGEVALADITAIVEGRYGKRPVERVLTGVVRAYINSNGQNVVTVSDPISIKLVPAAPVIETAYYYVGAANEWGGQTYKLVNSGADVYEDPIFTVTVPAQGGDHWFKVMPESAFALGSIWDSPSVVGVYTNGTSDMEGKFIVDKNGNDNPGSGANSWCIKEGDYPGDFYKITLNMLDQTYTITPVTLAAQYYLVGAASSWNSSDKHWMFTPESKTVVSYTTKWTGDRNLKIWAFDDFGDWGKCYGALTDGDASASGTLTNSNSGAIVCPEGDAFYTITLDFGTMNYTWTKLDNQAPTEYESISLIGEFNGWGGDFDLTQVAPHNWYGEFTQETSGMLKYRANHDWTTNWGFGNDGDWNVSEGINQTGTNGGGNILVPAGTYDVYLNDITNSMIFVAK
ncbi:MAG: DUF5115 domain-containing protein [Prevotella sp.]|nr:DUF5115 domain-containing protein [Prevotella sp.]